MLTASERDPVEAIGESKKESGTKYDLCGYVDGKTSHARQTP